MPYSAEINDITLMVSHHHESDVLLKRTIDAFDRLYAESAESTRILAIGVHPYVTGAAHRIKYFEQLYAYINRHPGVVHWTGQQIYDWCRRASAAAEDVVGQRPFRCDPALPSIPRVTQQRLGCATPPHAGLRAESSARQDSHARGRKLPLAYPQSNSTRLGGRRITRRGDVAQNPFFPRPR